MALDLEQMVDTDAVRAALDLGLESDALPDNKIYLSIFVKPARRAVLALYADAEGESINTAGGDSVITAFNILLAAKILPSLPQLTAQKAGEDSYNRQLESVDERVARLEAKAFAELVDLVGEEATEIPAIFGLLHGTRGL